MVYGGRAQEERKGERNMYAKVIIMGRLGADPETRVAPSGTEACNMSVAVNTRWTNRQTGKPGENVSWFRVVSFGNLAKAIHGSDRCRKGNLVLVEGRPQFRTYQPAEGESRKVFEIIAQRVTFLSRSPTPGNSEAQDSNETAESEEDATEPI